MVIFLYLIDPCISNTYLHASTLNNSFLLNLTLDENVFCRSQIHNFFAVFNSSTEISPNIFWLFQWQLFINQRQVAVTLKIFSNALYWYGSITLSTESVNFFIVAITVETTNVRISVLMSSSSLAVNLLISLDIGQVDISCVKQLGPLIQLLLFDDNSSGKHPLSGRSAIFSILGRLYHISVLVNTLTSLTRFCTNCLYCFLSFWIHAKIIPESVKHRTLGIGNLLVSAEYTLCTNLARNRLLINSNRGIVST